MKHRSVIVVAAGVVLAVLGLRASSAGPDEKPAAPLIAVCDMDQLVRDLMNHERYDQRLKKEYDENKAQSKELYDDMSKKYKAFQDAPETGSEHDRLEKEYDAAYEKYHKHRDQWGKKHEKLWMDLNWEAFSEAKSAAVRVATDHGYAYLLGSDTTDEAFASSSLSRFHYERGARRVLMAPEGTDITKDVRDALRVQKAPKEPKKDDSDDE